MLALGSPMAAQQNPLPPSLVRRDGKITILYRKTGAGEGIRTLYPNLGKRRKWLNMLDVVAYYQ
jgi:hypothetical protein